MSWDLEVSLPPGRTSVCRWAILVTAPSCLVRQSNSLRPDTCLPSYLSLLRIRPRRPGLIPTIIGTRTGPTTSSLRLRPLATRSTRPATYLRTRWGLTVTRIRWGLTVTGAPGCRRSLPENRMAVCRVGSAVCAREGGRVYCLCSTPHP
jgi:hypothetical protein